MARDKCLYVWLRSSLADEVRDVNGVEVARLDETVYGVEINVVRIHMPWVRPPGSLHRRFRRRLHARGLRADDQMFTVRFVPDRRNLDAAFRRHFKRAQLRPGLMRETVTHPEGELLDLQHYSRVLYWFTPDARNPPSTARHWPVM